MSESLHINLGVVNKSYQGYNLIINKYKKRYAVNLYRKDGSHPEDLHEAQDIAWDRILSFYPDWHVYDFAVLCWENLLLYGETNEELMKFVEFLENNNYSDRQIWCEIIKRKTRYKKTSPIDPNIKSKLFELYKGEDIDDKIPEYVNCIFKSEQKIKRLESRMTEDK